MLNLALYGIKVSSNLYAALAALLVIAGLFIIIRPQAFLRWGRGGRDYPGKEPPRSALWAARLVGGVLIAMAVIAYLSTQMG